MEDPPRLLRTAELATRLGLSARLIQQYRAEGLLTPAAETPRGHARWDEADVRAQFAAIREVDRQQRRERQREREQGRRPN